MSMTYARLTANGTSTLCGDLEPAQVGYYPDRHGDAGRGCPGQLPDDTCVHRIDRARVAPQHGIDANYAELNYMDRLMSTYVELVKSTPFVAEAMGRLHLQRDSFEVFRAVKVSVVGTTQLMRIDVDGADPVQAAAGVPTTGIRMG